MVKGGITLNSKFSESIAFSLKTFIELLSFINSIALLSISFSVLQKKEKDNR